MNPARRPRVWRWSTVLPTVATAVAGTAAAVVIAQPATPQLTAHRNHQPVGKVTAFHGAAGGIRAVGWAYDPDSRRSALRVYVAIDNKRKGHTTANLPGHGFKIGVLVPQGRHTVCITARNVGKGHNQHVRCTTRTFAYGPTGALDRPTASHGRLRVTGWAFDPDSKHRILTTRLSVDGRTYSLVDNASRSDVARAHPFAGAKHGFVASYAVAQGTHRVCAIAHNVSYGSDTNFGCRTVTLDDSPRGGLNSAGQHAGKLRITGWTFDPDAPTSARTVTVAIDSAAHNIVANGSRSDVARAYPSAGARHGFAVSYTVAEGRHTVCVTARNVSYGTDKSFGCRTVTINFRPTATTTALTATTTGARLTGWASDPDTTGAIKVLVTLDGHAATTVTANGKGGAHSGHNFSLALATKSGKHTICATALNVLYGTRNSPASCRTITLTLQPIGWYDSLTRQSSSGPVQVKGWALDPDGGTAPITVTATIDGDAASAQTLTANGVRPDVAEVYPATGPNHGFSAVLAATDGEHTVCLTAHDVGAGSDVSLGCKVINAVHPTAPTAPRSVVATPGYGGATVAWAPPASDGGAPWTKFVITSSPGGAAVTVGPTARSATITGLKSNTVYSFTVTAVNVAGSAATTSAAVRTQSGPPPQRTPAPVSTSRYIRNIRGASAAELALMRNEGAADAKANPSGHGYLILLDIGGQDDYDGGAVLSATTRFVSYGNLVKDIESYVAGYHSGQRANAPVTIAIGTNNDMDVSATSGRSWADRVVDPVVAYARRYTGLKIAGANDVEPGFRATYSQTKSWLSGYLGATSAPFVFNGSADGCAWTVTNRGCNNGWTMSGLYYLAAGAAPTRMLNLPQIYNTTMAGQWKYISLTGVGQKHPRINFVGTLTEWTACDQTNSCGSLTGHNAWSTMWSNLQSDSRLKVSSLPYSTDLRIDR